MTQVSGHFLRIARGTEIIGYLIDEGTFCLDDPELARERLITTPPWNIRQGLAITEENEEPLKRFCVQWLSDAAACSRER